MARGPSIGDFFLLLLLLVLLLLLLLLLTNTRHTSMQETSGIMRKEARGARVSLLPPVHAR